MLIKVVKNRLLDLTSPIKIPHLSAYQLANKINNSYEGIKAMQLYCGLPNLTISQYYNQMKYTKAQIAASEKIVQVHFSTCAKEKRIDIPHSIDLEKKPFRTQKHISRLRKAGYHIQKFID